MIDHTPLFGSLIIKVEIQYLALSGKHSRGISHVASCCVL